AGRGATGRLARSGHEGCQWAAYCLVPPPPAVSRRPRRGRYWILVCQTTAALASTRPVKRRSVALVASGHLHKAHDFRHDGTRYIWAPSSAFLVGPALKAPPMPGEDRLGAVVYDLEAGTIKAKIIQVPGLSLHWLDDVAEEVYPRDPDKRAAASLG